MNYRLFHPGDFAQLYAIEQACFEPPLRFPHAYMQHLVTYAGAATWVAEEGGQLAAFAIVVRDQQTAYIETIEVASGYRRRGVGAELLHRLEDSAQIAGADSIWLHVDAENISAIQLYEAHGYQREGREDGYYPNGHHALVYAKPLSKTQAQTPA